jgi:hypothetical protein
LKKNGQASACLFILYQAGTAKGISLIQGNYPVYENFHRRHSAEPGIRSSVAPLSRFVAGNTRGVTWMLEREARM